jgi:predicted dehydrogenase
MTSQDQVRWGIIGTANIARAAFLPGLRQAGGVAAAVAGRDGPAGCGAVMTPSAG